MNKAEIEEQIKQLEQSLKSIVDNQTLNIDEMQENIKQMQVKNFNPVISYFMPHSGSEERIQRYCANFFEDALKWLEIDAEKNNLFLLVHRQKEFGNSPSAFGKYYHGSYENAKLPFLDNKNVITLNMAAFNYGSTLKDAFKTILHEFQHHFQHQDNRLEALTHYWRKGSKKKEGGKVYKAIWQNEQTVYRPYNELPWEIEAEKMAKYYLNEMIKAEAFDLKHLEMKFGKQRNRPRGAKRLVFQPFE